VLSNIIYNLGALLFVGLPPMGCLPVVRALKYFINIRIGKFLEEQNRVVVNYNEKLKFCFEV